MHLKNGVLLQGGKYIIKENSKTFKYCMSYNAVQADSGKKVIVFELFVEDVCVRAENSSDVSFPLGIGDEKIKEYSELCVRCIKNEYAASVVSSFRIIEIFAENGTLYYVVEIYGAIKSLFGCLLGLIVLIVVFGGLIALLILVIALAIFIDVNIFGGSGHIRF